MDRWSRIFLDGANLPESAQHWAAIVLAIGSGFVALIWL
jgi:hypothetical protein